MKLLIQRVMYPKNRLISSHKDVMSNTHSCPCGCYDILSIYVFSYKRRHTSTNMIR